MEHRTFKLNPIDGRESLNNHHVNEYNTYSDLISYTTRVASYNHKDKSITRRHINAFLSFYGFDTMSKKEMEKFIS